MTAGRKRKSAVIGIWPMLLLLCVMASTAVLFSRMRSFSADTFENVIPLIAPAQPADETSEADAAVSESTTVPAETARTEGNPSFVAHDAGTVWQTDTQVDIFRLFYENGEGKITVRNNDGKSDKLIAPGTSNQYVFTLENNGDVPLDYTMTMEAWVEGTGERLPVRARVWDYTNQYLLGSAGQSADVLALNTVQDAAALGAGRYAYYTLEWEWPFEQGTDEHDMMLGNLAADGDITLTVRITTTAVYDENPDDPKVSQAGVPGLHTGDDTPVTAFVIVLAAALLLAGIAFFAGRKQKDDKDGQTKI